MLKFLPKQSSLLFLTFLIGIHSWILTKLIFFPYPEFFVYSYLANRGLFPYRQILDQHFPGLMFFPVNFDNLGMTSPFAARVWLIGIVVLVHALLFLIGKRIFKSEKKALLGNFIFLLWQPFFEGWVLWIDSFLPLLLLPAFYFSYLAWQKGGSRNFFLTGLFLGIALLFKQVVLPLAVLVIAILFLKRRDFSNVLWYGLGFIPLPLLMVLYFWVKGALWDFWYWTVVFNLTTFAELGRKSPFLTGVFRVGAVFGFIVFSLFYKSQQKLAFWIGLFVLGSLAAAFARFDFVHFQPALPFVALGTVLALSFLWENKKARALIGVYLAGAIFFLSVFYQGHLGQKILFFDNETYMIAEKIKELSDPGERIFVFGAVPHLYQMSNTLPSGDVFVFQFPWFLMITEDRILDGIEKDRPRLVVADRSVVIQGDPITSYAAKINSYLLENYETKEKIGNVEFLVPKKN